MATVGVLFAAAATAAIFFAPAARADAADGDWPRQAVAAAVDETVARYALPGIAVGVVVDGEVRPRWVTTVAGSFDHRVVDGDGMSRFIADVASVLEEPALLVD